MGPLGVETSEERPAFRDRISVSLPIMRLLLVVPSSSRRALQATMTNAEIIHEELEALLTVFLKSRASRSSFEAVNINVTMGSSTEASITGRAVYRDEDRTIPTEDELRAHLTTYFSFLGTETLESALVRAGLPVEDLIVEVGGRRADGLRSDTDREIKDSNGVSTRNVSIGAVVIGAVAVGVGILAFLYRQRYFHSRRLSEGTAHPEKVAPVMVLGLASRSDDDDSGQATDSGPPSYIDDLGTSSELYSIDNSALYSVDLDY